MWIWLCVSLFLAVCVSESYTLLFPLCFCASMLLYQPWVYSFGLSRPLSHISIHHSLRAHPGASPRSSVPRPTCGRTLVSPQAPHQACGQGHLVMDGSVGGRRPEETHMLTCRTQCRYKDTHTHKDQQGLYPTSCSEREGGGNRKEEGTPNRHN